MRDFTKLLVLCLLVMYSRVRADDSDERHNKLESMFTTITSGIEQLNSRMDSLSSKRSRRANNDDLPDFGVSEDPTMESIMGPYMNGGLGKENTCELPCIQEEIERMKEHEITRLRVEVTALTMQFSTMNSNNLKSIEEMKGKIEDHSKTIQRFTDQKFTDSPKAEIQDNAQKVQEFMESAEVRFNKLLRKKTLEYNTAIANLTKMLEIERERNDVLEKAATAYHPYMVKYKYHENRFSNIADGCWYLARRTDATLGRWHPSKKQLQGVDAYGTFKDDPLGYGQYSRKFDRSLVTDFLFTSGSMSHWLVMAKQELDKGNGIWFNLRATMSSINGAAHDVYVRNDHGDSYSPRVSMSANSYSPLIYAHGTNWKFNDVAAGNRGSNLFIRTNKRNGKCVYV